MSTSGATGLFPLRSRSELGEQRSQGGIRRLSAHLRAITGEEERARDDPIGGRDADVHGAHRLSVGRVRAGDPRLHALTLMGPMVMGLLWHETLEPVGGTPVDLAALARQHSETVLAGMLMEQAR